MTRPLLYVSQELADEWVLVPRELMRRIVRLDPDADTADAQAWLFLAEIVARAELLDVKEH